MEHDRHQSIPQFLSTHPASENRVKKIETLVPEAMKDAEESGCNFTRGVFDDFRNSLKGSSSSVQMGGGRENTRQNDWF